MGTCPNHPGRPLTTLVLMSPPSFAIESDEWRASGPATTASGPPRKAGPSTNRDGGFSAKGLGIICFRGKEGGEGPNAWVETAQPRNMGGVWGSRRARRGLRTGRALDFAPPAITAARPSRRREVEPASSPDPSWSFPPSSEAALRCPSIIRVARERQGGGGTRKKVDFSWPDDVLRRGTMRLEVPQK